MAFICGCQNEDREATGLRCNSDIGLVSIKGINAASKGRSERIATYHRWGIGHGHIVLLNSGPRQLGQSGPNSWMPSSRRDDPNQQLSELGRARMVAYSRRLKITTYDHVVSAQTIDGPLLNLSSPMDDHLLNAPSG